MWIRRLEVKSFAGIRSVELEFGPGLNVLYGPNETGKSSLVTAIRTALLLQDNSASRDLIEDWHADEPPQVSLEFEMEQQRIYRVRKSFGTHGDGSSYLDFSRDGEAFVSEAKGREVDGRLSELLRWGIEPPGGRGRRARGVPESFITTALLGEQSKVEDIFDRSLEDDPDESGKNRLAEVIQALAEDPRFRAVLDVVQEKVDEAFTATGRKKSGKASPWIRLRDDRHAAEVRRDEVNERQQSSESARIRIEELQEKLAQLRDTESLAADTHREIHEAWQSELARRGASEALTEATGELERISRLQEEVLGARNQRAAAGTRAEEAGAVLRGASEEVQTSGTNLQEAKERIRELQDDSAEQRRRLREQEIQNGLLQGESREKELDALLERAARLNEQDSQVGTLREQVDGVAATVQEAKELLETANIAFEREQSEVGSLKRTLDALAVLASRAELEKIEESAGKAKALTAEAEQLDTQAEKIRLEVDGLGVPDRSVMQGLAELQTELRVAEEKLRVGLSATIKATGDLEFEVARDGAASEPRTLHSESAEFDADVELDILIPGGVEISLRGGRKALREEARVLRNQWEAQTAPVFASSRCGSLGELEVLARRREESLEKVRGIEAEAAARRARLEGVSVGDGDDDAARAEQDRAESRLWARLGEGRDAAEFLAELQREPLPTAAEVESSIDLVERTLEQKKELAGQLTAQVSRDEGRLETMRTEFEARALDLHEARVGLPDDWEAVCSRAEAELEPLRGRLAQDRETLGAIQGEATIEVDTATRALAGAESIHEGATRARETAEQGARDAELDVVRAEAELSAKGEAAEREDIGAARALVDEREAALARHPKSASEIGESHVEDAKSLMARAKDETRRMELELRQAIGALEQAGGQYVDELLHQAKEALQAIGEREREMEIDFDAWMMLRDTLGEAEAEDSVHLGDALVDDIGSRMSDITSGRYGKLSLGPQLDTQGIELDGSQRDIEDLSVGTKEQLATLLRLSIAESLGTTLVLDDQLTQTDPDRMAWLNRLLRESATKIQIVVFTCRPADYLGPDEMRDPSFDEGNVRAVDLTPILERSLRASSEGVRNRAIEVASGAEVEEPLSGPTPLRGAATEVEAASSGSTTDLISALRSTLGGSGGGAGLEPKADSPEPVATPTIQPDRNDLVESSDGVIIDDSAEAPEIGEAVDHVVRMLSRAWETNSALRENTLAASLPDELSRTHLSEALEWLVEEGFIVKSATGFVSVEAPDELRESVDELWEDLASGDSVEGAAQEPSGADDVEDADESSDGLEADSEEESSDRRLITTYQDFWRDGEGLVAVGELAGDHSRIHRGVVDEVIYSLQDGSLDIAFSFQRLSEIVSEEARTAVEASHAGVCIAWFVREGIIGVTEDRLLELAVRESKLRELVDQLWDELRLEP